MHKSYIQPRRTFIDQAKPLKTDLKDAINNIMQIKQEL